MRITPTQHGFELAKSAAGYERSPGLHMSALYGAYYKAVDPRRFDKRGKDGKELPFDLKRLELGLVFEEMLESGLKFRLTQEDRPGEFQARDLGHDFDLAFSPDLLIFNGVTRLGEIKLTWMSARDVPVSPEQSAETGLPATWDGVGDAAFPEKFDKYFTQVKLYLHFLRLTSARLIVFFVNGNYAPPAPVVLAWDLEFTEAECAEEWGIIERFAREQGLLGTDIAS